MAQQHERGAGLWLDRLKAAGALAPGLPAEERFRRIAQALALKGYKIQVKDLSPGLRSAADAYLTHVGERDIVPRSEFWLLNADRRRDSEIDKHRAGALNDLVNLTLRESLSDELQLESRRLQKRRMPQLGKDQFLDLFHT